MKILLPWPPVFCLGLCLHRPNFNERICRSHTWTCSNVPQLMGLRSTEVHFKMASKIHLHCLTTLYTHHEAKSNSLQRTSPMHSFAQSCSSRVGGSYFTGEGQEHLASKTALSSRNYD